MTQSAICILLPHTDDIARARRRKMDDKDYAQAETTDYLVKMSVPDLYPEYQNHPRIRNLIIKLVRDNTERLVPKRLDVSKLLEQELKKIEVYQRKQKEERKKKGEATVLEHRKRRAEKGQDPDDIPEIGISSSSSQDESVESREIIKSPEDRARLLPFRYGTAADARPEDEDGDYMYEEEEGGGEEEEEEEDDEDGEDHDPPPPKSPRLSKVKGTGRGKRSRKAEIAAAPSSRPGPSAGGAEAIPPEAAGQAGASTRGGRGRAGRSGARRAGRLSGAGRVTISEHGRKKKTQAEKEHENALAKATWDETMSRLEATEIGSHLARSLKIMRDDLHKRMDDQGEVLNTWIAKVESQNQHILNMQNTLETLAQVKRREDDLKELKDNLKVPFVGEEDMLLVLNDKEKLERLYTYVSKVVNNMHGHYHINFNNALFATDFCWRLFPLHKRTDRYEPGPKFYLGESVWQLPWSMTEFYASAVESHKNFQMSQASVPDATLSSKEETMIEKWKKDFTNRRSAKRQELIETLEIVASDPDNPLCMYSEMVVMDGKNTLKVLFFEEQPNLNDKKAVDDFVGKHYDLVLKKHEEAETKKQSIRDAKAKKKKKADDTEKALKEARISSGLEAGSPRVAMNQDILMKAAETVRKQAADRAKGQARRDLAKDL